MSNNIHHTAIIEDSVQLGDDVLIGPYCHVSGNIKIGDRCKLLSHVCISNNVTLGEDNTIFHFASIGAEPQDLKYAGETSEVIIGNNNKIRECVTINPGTAGDDCKTIIGNNCTLMSSTHIAHDCIVGNDVVIASGTGLAGHVIVENNVIIGGLSGIHQFVHIGQGSMIGGLSAVGGSILPFAVAMGVNATINGINLTGLRRRKYTRDTIRQIQMVYKIIADKQCNSTMKERILSLANYDIPDKVSSVFYDFTKNLKREICKLNY